MPALNIVADGDNAWPDLKEKGFIEGDLEAVAFLAGGMVSGQPAVALRIRLPDGSYVIAQTSGRLFSSAGRMLNAKYPKLHDGP